MKKIAVGLLIIFILAGCTTYDDSDWRRDALPGVSNSDIPPFNRCGPLLSQSSASGSSDQTTDRGTSGGISDSSSAQDTTGSGTGTAPYDTSASGSTAAAGSSTGTQDTSGSGTSDTSSTPSTSGQSTGTQDTSGGSGTSTASSTTSTAAGSSGTSGSQGTSSGSGTSSGTSASSSDTSTASTSTSEVLPNSSPMPAPSGISEQSSLTNIRDAIGKSWKLIEVQHNNRYIDYDRRTSGDIFTMNITQGRVTGAGSPNQYSASFTTSEMDPLAVTFTDVQLIGDAVVYYPEKLKERDFLMFLQNTYRWGLSDGKLVLHSRSDRGGDIIMVFSL